MRWEMAIGTIAPVRELIGEWGANMGPVVAMVDAAWVRLSARQPKSFASEIETTARQIVRPPLAQSRSVARGYFGQVTRKRPLMIRGLSLNRLFRRRQF
jgi:hypothetical protein